MFYKLDERGAGECNELIVLFLSIRSSETGMDGKAWSYMPA